MEKKEICNCSLCNIVLGNNNALFKTEENKQQQKRIAKRFQIIKIITTNSEYRLAFDLI